MVVESAGSGEGLQNVYGEIGGSRKGTMIRTLRVLGWALPCMTLLLATGCRAGQGRGDHEQDCADALDNDGDGAIDCADSDCAALCEASFRLRLLPDTPDSRAVDLLYVLDDSPDSDADFLRYDLPALLSELRRRTEGLPDVHVGVTTTDLGAGAGFSQQCDAEGDGARLITGGCAEPTGVAWIVDSAPRDCVVERDVEGQCLAHDCSADNCAHEPAATLAEDAQGCPRCRNYAQQSAESVLSCMADVGRWGCPFEQQLEAMYRALDGHPDNVWFLREEAHLAVILLNTEDDCSVADPYFWDMSDNSLESELGPVSNFRCFEFGVTCDENDRTAVGPRTGCEPRDDPGPLLHPIARYTDFLLAIKEPAQLTVTALVGPVEDDTVWVSRDVSDLPYVDLACLGRHPGVRLGAFTRTIDEADELSRGIQPSCGDFSADLNALRATGRHLLRALGDGCAPTPPLGCSDVAAALGRAGDGRACNDTCEPTCAVTDVLHADTAQETATAVVPCTQVCPDGPCPDNVEPALAWYGGHPPALDPALPVAACWHFSYLERCADSNGARLVVSRREPLDGWSYAEAECLAVLPEANRCTDGLDNDGDCLTDLEDPDCGLASP